MSVEIVTHQSPQPSITKQATRPTLTNCDVVTGVASSRCDYATSVGRLSFAAGETSKTISIPIVDDAFAEGNESFTITLSNAIGAPAGHARHGRRNN